MSQQSPYEQLGVAEDASFEEIQAAKQRAMVRFSSDRQSQEKIESAYDAVLMERLKLRQQGKIKVPEGIRFPEKIPTTVIPKPKTSALANNSPSWLVDTFERPSQSEALTTSGVYIVLGGAALIPAIANTGLPTLMALGTGFSLYFINQKQRRFKRALLGSLIALIVGTATGSVLVNYFQLPVSQIGIPGEVFASLLTFLSLWIVSSFSK
jgi:hypothetical protein